jgi:hypothetical protein
MQALLAVLRFPFDARRFHGGASVGRTRAAARPARHDVCASASDPRPFVAAPDAVAAPTEPAPAVLEATFAPSPAAPLPVAPDLEADPAPAETVAPGVLRLSDPRGLRVVPFRPTTRWPLHRACARIHDPFRAFPDRGAQLALWLEDARARR